jgi:hypothetical protein
LRVTRSWQGGSATLAKFLVRNGRCATRRAKHTDSPILKTVQRGFLENITPQQQSKDIPIWMEEFAKATICSEQGS